MKVKRNVAAAACVMAACVAMLSGCKGKGNKEGQYPENFSKIGDGGRVAYIIRTAEPDSVARFIIYGALGKVPGARIDTLAIATGYAFDHLKGEALEKFGVEYDGLLERLPLQDKMKILAMGGSEDPQGLGYRLGLEYLTSIRDNHKDVKAIKEELAAFKKACAKDTGTYRRFLIGFKTVLRVDSGKDLPKEVYDTFINFE